MLQSANPQSPEDQEQPIAPLNQENLSKAPEEPSQEALNKAEEAPNQGEHTGNPITPQFQRQRRRSSLARVLAEAEEIALDTKTDAKGSPRKITV